MHLVTEQDTIYEFYALLTVNLDIRVYETNMMHYLSSVYSVTISVQLSGLLVAHHQEVTMYTCDNCYVLDVS
jgi:hypothetical protein